MLAPGPRAFVAEVRSMREPPTQASLVVIVTAGQGSLSFQLLGADGGLYDFGRALCLLSTVTGLTVPPHNFMAVYNVKMNT